VGNQQKIPLEPRSRIASEIGHRGKAGRQSQPIASVIAAKTLRRLRRWW
jgi:hypothetical protein